MSETLKNYAFDLGYEIKLRALEAVRERDAAGSEDRSSESGRVMAFYEVISLMQQNAESFGIPLSDLRLDDIVPDRDLV
jgi:hypothetical protein